MYSQALLGDFAHAGQLVALCDPNPLRAGYWNTVFEDTHKMDPLPVFAPSEFEKMIRDERIDVVIVTSIDRTHHLYIERAMRAGCDVITEKPMTIDEEKCAIIQKAIRETGRTLRVTFNYRYAPRNSKVKALLMDGVIGKVLSVHFEWLLNTQHGADYFRRWHRDKRNSGGLIVHKATHHFDLVNWWLGTTPETVFAMGDLRFYGKANAESRGVTGFYHRSTGSKAAQNDPFALHLDRKSEDAMLRNLYHDVEEADGYLRDQSVFGDGISIEDDVAVLVRYQNKVVLSYHLTAYSPWEGFRVMFNGTKGRLEYDCMETPYVSGDEDDHNISRNVSGASPVEVKEPTTIIIHPLWGKAHSVPLPQVNEGGHGGADQNLLRDIFDGSPEDPLGRAAGFEAGAMSILTGIAANRSMQTGLPVKVRDLFPF